jgi:hypothetical protein
MAWLRAVDSELAGHLEGVVLRSVWTVSQAKLDGSLWHAYRRKWAIERKHLPLKDVAAAGGWKDVNTLLEIYQQPDDAENMTAD